MPPHFALVFPGQGSQRPGMGQALYESSQSARTVFDHLSDELGISVPDLCFRTDEDTLRKTENAQIALFTVSCAAQRAFTDSLPAARPSAVAGHSVGEYAALVAAGALSLRDSAILVRKRGVLMAESGSLRKGGMAAVLGGEASLIEQVCADVSSLGSEVVIANYNCPGQTVISGDDSAVRKASEILMAAGVKRVLPLNVSGAFHSPLMAEPAERFGEELALASFLDPEIPVFSNVTGESEGGRANWPDLMKRQLASPVKWSQSVEAMISRGIKTFIECGVGEVLCGLIKRVCPEAKTACFQHPDDLRKLEEILA